MARKKKASKKTDSLEAKELQGQHVDKIILDDPIDDESKTPQEPKKISKGLKKFDKFKKKDK